MSGYYWNPTVGRYGTLQSQSGDSGQIIYDGDGSTQSAVSMSQLQPAGTMMSWISGEQGDFGEILWNVAARAGISMVYDRKPVMSAEIKQFAMVEAATTLFFKQYLRWIQLSANPPVTIKDPREFLNRSDFEGALNATLQNEIVNQGYNLVFKKGIKVDFGQILRGLVSRVAANMVQRRNQTTGANFRSV